MQIVRHWSVRGMRRWERRNAPFSKLLAGTGRGAEQKTGRSEGLEPRGYKGGQDASFVCVVSSKELFFVAVVLCVFVELRGGPGLLGGLVIAAASWWFELRVPSLWAPSREGCVRWPGVRREGRGREAPLTSSAAQPAHPGGECRRESANRRTTRVQVTSIGLVGLVR